MRRVYRIDSNITPEENDIISGQMTQDELDLVASLENIDSFDEIDDEGKIVTYIICTDEQLNVLEKIADKYKVILEINDITNMFLNDVVDINDSDFQKYKDEQLNK